MSDGDKRPDRIDSRDALLSRRKLLATSGAMLGAISGCTGDGGTPTDAGGATPTPRVETRIVTEEVEGEERTVIKTKTVQVEEEDTPTATPTVSDNTLDTVGLTELPTDLNFSPFGKKFSGNLDKFINNHLALNYEDGTTDLVLLDELNYDVSGKRVTYKFKDGFVWWDGKEVNARDLFVQEEIDRLQTPDNSDVEEWEIVDDKTLVAHWKEEPSELFGRKGVGDTRLRLHPKVWEEWLERYGDATSQEQRDQVTADLEDFKIDGDQLMAQGLGNGPYEVTTLNSKEIIASVNPDHPWAEDIEVEHVRFISCKGDACDQLVTNDAIDFRADGSFPEDLRGSTPSYVKTLAQYDLMAMWGLMINQAGPNKKHAQNKHVRRAMAAVLDSHEHADLTQYGNPLSGPTTGMDPGTSENIFGDDFGNLHNYGWEKDYEQADRHLERAGYSRQNGSVVDDEGETVQFTFVPCNCWRFFTSARIANQQLIDYGFDIDFRPVGRGSQLDINRNKMDEWDLGVEQHPAPWKVGIRYYDTASRRGLRLYKSWDERGKVEDWVNEGTERSPYTGRRLTPEINANKGNWDSLELADDTEEINIHDLYVKGTGAKSIEAHHDAVRKLGRYWNHYVPKVDLVASLNGSYGDTASFDWPDGDNRAYKRKFGIFYAIKRGMVEYSDLNRRQ